MLFRGWEKVIGNETEKFNEKSDHTEKAFSRGAVGPENTLLNRLARQVDNVLLIVNVDDVSGETISHAIEGLMSLGAGSVNVVQTITKKGRPGFLFFIDAPGDRVQILGGFLAGELGTLGVRVLEPRHISFDYRMRDVLLIDSGNGNRLKAPVRVKETLNDEGRVVSVKAEYDGLKAALTQFKDLGLEVSLASLKGLVEQTVLGGKDLFLGGIQAKYPGD